MEPDDLTLFDDVPRLDASYSLPVDQPFSTTTARQEAGLGFRELRNLVTLGVLRHPIRGVYVSSAVPDSTALRCACLRLVVPEDAVVVDRHAGWMHGATMMLAPGEHLELSPIRIFRPTGGSRLRNALADSGERMLRPSDIVELHGLRVTTPIRTAWDLGRVRWTDTALAGLDQLLRLGAFTREELIAGVERFRGMRWVTTLRVMAPLADGRAESPPESILRLRWIEAHLLTPYPQIEVWDGSELLARLDLGNRDLRFAAEYDGAEWHSTPDQLTHDRRRRSRVEEQGRWHVIALRKENLFGQQQNAHQLLVAGAHEARARFGIRLPAA